MPLSQLDHIADISHQEGSHSEQQPQHKGHHAGYL